MRKLLFIILCILFSTYAYSKVIIEDDYINGLLQKAYDYYENGMYDSSEIVYLETIDLLEAKYGHYSTQIADTYLNIGVVYKKLYHLDKALEYINTAEEIYLDLYPDSEVLSFIYNNKGNIYFIYGDYSESERYYNYCLDLLSRLKKEKSDTFGTVYLNLFNIYIVKNQLDKAEQLLEYVKAFDSNEPDLRLAKHKFLAQAYDILGNPDLAIEEIGKAKNAINESDKRNPHDLIELNHREASIRSKIGQYDLSLDLLVNNLRQYHELNSKHYHKIADTYALIGEIYYFKKDYRNCYKWLSNAIIDLNKHLYEVNISNPRVLERLFVDIKYILAKTSYDLYATTNNISYLEESLLIYNDLIDIIKVSKLHMRNESSKYYSAIVSSRVIHEAINVALELYLKTDNEDFLNSAFLTAESSKAFVLLSEIKGTEALQFADLPKSIKSRENYLNSEITAYESMIIEENISNTADSIRLHTYNEKLFKLKDDYNTLLDSIEKFYPNYFDLKYNPHFLSPKEVQAKLSRDEALVEYVLADTVLTTFIIDKRDIQVVRQYIDLNFITDCQEYFNLLQSQDFSKDVHHTYERYVSLGNSFFEILVNPVLERTESRDITFIPDAEIMYLPFESFITEEVDKQYINYHDLPYLIYDVSIGYSYSSTLLFNDRVKTHSPKHKVLAFAPNYENLHDPIDPIEWNREANPDFLLPLQGAKKEVEFISKRVPSIAFMDSAASEANFKKYASDYYVLHLAMHTIMDDEEPMHSKLAFTRNFSDSTEDHDLFTYEIYNMKLNAEMIVLSSCSSGYGKMQKGEGMMSMSRGFMYAGCPSIIMTLWQISDRSSSELMSSFYKHLKRGKSKKKALRQAKIDYIRSSDRLKSNPYFWSAFMVVGDNSPLYGKTAGFYLTLLILGFMFIVGLTYRKQIFRKKR